MDNPGILLESGTNELEIVTFNVGVNLFSINVLKVREIINPLPVTTVPESHPSVEGVVQVRGEILPVISLSAALKLPTDRSLENTKFIISELNQMKVVFRVDEVHRIQRISWDQIDEPASLSMGLEETTSGVVKMDEKIILLLDYEKIVYDITNTGNFDIAGINKNSSPAGVNRSEKTIYVAEDSMMLRQLLEDTLVAAGYEKLHFFHNGQEALDQIMKLSKERGEEMFQSLNLLITDIEMPKMDGHHLTKNIKENAVTNKLPIVIFSSLITTDLQHKGEHVGADAQVSKPEIHQLIKIVDSLAL
jgi:two-component system chemotaxis response regulator CheV